MWNGHDCTQGWQQHYPHLPCEDDWHFLGWTSRPLALRLATYAPLHHIALHIARHYVPCREACSPCACQCDEERVMMPVFRQADCVPNAQLEVLWLLAERVEVHVGMGIPWPAVLFIWRGEII